MAWVSFTDRQVRNYFSRFRSSDTFLIDKCRPERLSDLDQDAFREFVEFNRHKSTQELALDLNLTLLEKDQKLSEWSVWVLHDFIENNKEDRISIATSLLSRQRNNSFLKNIITVDEIWDFNDNAKGSGLTLKNLLNLPQRFELHGKKVMLHVWSDHCDIIYFEFLYCNRILNADLHSQQLQRVHGNLLRKRHELINRWKVVLLLDNGRLHSACLPLYFRSCRKKYWI